MINDGPLSRIEERLSKVELQLTRVESVNLEQDIYISQVDDKEI